MGFSIELGSGPRLRHIRISAIEPNPWQPRKIFDPEALEELAGSIKRYGVITPLTVCRKPEGYLLIAGERRLRASKMAGLETVPCYIVEADAQTTSAMALVENLQRRDLDPFEEARGLLKLIEDFGLTQSQAAKQVGKTQAAVSNKLRLLRLSEETVAVIREKGLTERHGRALLAIEDEKAQAEAARYIAKKGLNVSESESYIEKLKENRRKPAPLKMGFIKDVRIFVNSINKIVEAARASGVAATCTQKTEEGGLTLTITMNSALQNR